MNSELRQKVRERDDHECKFCEDTENLHTHHIVPRSAGGSDKKENLMTVCASCHKIIENSQGAALERIKKEDREEELGELENKIKQLEEENEKLRNNLVEVPEETQTVEKEIYRVKTQKVVGLDTVSYLGTDKDKAVEKMSQKDKITLVKDTIEVDVELEINKRTGELEMR